MSVKLNPYLTFNGNTKEVMEFYHTVFGGKLDLSTFGDFPNPPEGYADKIMHAALTSDDLTIMASEGMPGGTVNFGDNVSLSLSGDDHEKLTGYFKALSEDGHVTMPLEKQMWGDVFGMLKDKYGINWLVNIDSKPAK
ncbi:MAG TPA: VOC family protein [Candidatus Saccharimonadia bacterium]|nr:VOC family protein [Candidatus Saccharimonadia bacterium]